MKCYPGQISQIFQKSKQREEDGHGRQHDGHNPCQNPVDTVYQSLDQGIGNLHGSQPQGQFFFYGEEEIPEEAGRVVGSRHGEPEHPHEEKDHDQTSCEPSRHDPVYEFFPFPVVGPGIMYRLGGQLLRRKIQTFIVASDTAAGQDGLFQAGQIPGASGTAGHYGKLQHILEKVKIDLDPFFSGFVAQVYTEDQRDPLILYLFQGQDLFQQMKPSFQTGGIPYDHHGVCLFGT